MVLSDALEEPAASLIMMTESSSAFPCTTFSDYKNETRFLRNVRTYLFYTVCDPPNDHCLILTRMFCSRVFFLEVCIFMLKNFIILNIGHVMLKLIDSLKLMLDLWLIAFRSFMAIVLYVL